MDEDFDPDEVTPEMGHAQELGEQEGPDPSIYLLNIKTNKLPTIGFIQ